MSFSILLQNFVKLACLEDAFLKIGILVCNLQASQIMSKKILISCLLSLTSGKNVMVIVPVVSEILGGVPPAPDAIALSKRADAINR